VPNAIKLIFLKKKSDLSKDICLCYWISESRFFQCILYCKSPRKKKSKNILSNHYSFNKVFQKPLLRSISYNNILSILNRYSKIIRRLQIILKVTNNIMDRLLRVESRDQCDDISHEWLCVTTDSRRIFSQPRIIHGFSSSARIQLVFKSSTSCHIAYATLRTYYNSIFTNGKFSLSQHVSQFSKCSETRTESFARYMSWNISFGNERWKFDITLI